MGSDGSKLLVSAAGALVLVAAVSALTALLVIPDAAPFPEVGSDPVAASRLAALEQRIGELEGSLANLPLQQPRRSPEGWSPPAPQSHDAGDRTAAERPAPLNPRALLAEYVASFAGGGEGSEFFRMAVAAYAWTLRRDLHAIVLDEALHANLRLQVIAMLGGGSFRGDAPTIDVLLALLRRGGFEAGEKSALQVLGGLGDEHTARLLESFATTLRPASVRDAAYATIVDLAGPEADAFLLRLFELERDPQGRMRLIALARGIDLDATVRLFDLASRQELDVRLVAADAIGAFPGQPVAALVEAWYAREPEEAVRARLMAARDALRTVPRWHELQVTGAPDVARPEGDDPHAWASATADGGLEWIELEFPPRRANRITIFETCVPGAVTAVSVSSGRGDWEIVFQGDDPTRAPGPFTVRFDTTVRPVTRARIDLDTSRRSGWNEIDAVELAGPDGASWATHAAASSRYGQGGTRVQRTLTELFDFVGR